MIGAQALECLSNLYWNASSPECYPLECPELQPPPNAQILPPCNNEYQSTCELICNEGYYLDGVIAFSQTCDLAENNSVNWSFPKICKGKNVNVKSGTCYNTGSSWQTMK